MTECGQAARPVATHGAAPALRLAILQFAPVPCDSAGNGERIVAGAHSAAADLLVTPELALTGYDVGDEAAELARPLYRGAEPVPGLADVPGLVLGMIERGRTGLPYNSAVLLRHGRAVFRHRKLYLPTYGMFDEGRFFGRGESVRVVDVGGWRVGLLICEDFWHPALAYLLAVQGLELLVVLAAAPGRGIGTDTGTVAGFTSSEAWERIALTTAQLYGVYVALANRTGAEGGVSFAGGSLVADPAGTIAARVDGTAETVLHATLERAGLERARRPYHHERDDDPSLTLRELHRILAAPSPTAGRGR